MSADDKTRVALIDKNSREGVAVELSEFKGHKLCQVRVVIRETDVEPEKPTKQSFALKFDKVGALIEALQDAQTEAKRRGWLSAA